MQMAPLATITTALINNVCVAAGPTINRRRNNVVVVAKKVVNDEVKVVSGRRVAMIGVAAAAVAAVVASGSTQRSAFAADEPKPGTAEARKKYASVCVTMPTAKVCRN